MDLLAELKEEVAEDFIDLTDDYLEGKSLLPMIDETFKWSINNPKIETTSFKNVDR